MSLEHVEHSNHLGLHQKISAPRCGAFIHQASFMSARRNGAELTKAMFEYAQQVALHLGGCCVHGSRTMFVCLQYVAPAGSSAAQQEMQSSPATLPA